MNGISSRSTASLRRALACALALTLAALLAGLEHAKADETVTDGRGRLVEITDTSRIVSIGGSVTEILYDLGLADHIVAVDDTSLYPPEALKTKPSIGYVRALSAEGVLSQGPTLILAEADAGPPPVVDVLMNASVPFVVLDGRKTPEAVADHIRFVAKAVGATAKGDALAKEVEAGFDRLAAARAKVATPLRVVFVMSLRDGQPLVAGEGTAADAMIRLAGAENAAKGVKGYKAMTTEAMVEAAPEAVIMMRQGPTPVSAETVFAAPAFAGSPAAQAKRLVLVDGLGALGFGPRSPEILLALCGALDPACAAPAP